MSDDPAERLRQSNQISIPGVLDVGDSDDAAEMTAMMSEVVQIPVRVEWVAGISCNRGTTTGTQVAGSPNAGGQTGDGNNRACANQAGRRRALT